MQTAHEQDFYLHCGSFSVWSKQEKLMFLSSLVDLCVLKSFGNNLISKFNEECQAFWNGSNVLNCPSSSSSLIQSCLYDIVIPSLNGRLDDWSREQTEVQKSGEWFQCHGQRSPSLCSHSGMLTRVSCCQSVIVCFCVQCFSILVEIFVC